LKATIRRNSIRVGKNSKSYNDKHPENPVMFKVIKSALKKAVKVDMKGFAVPDYPERKHISMVSKRSKQEFTSLL